MNETPIYTSNTSAKSFWQKYHIYDDRVEFQTFPFGLWVIPFDQIESVEVSEPMIKAILNLRFDIKNFPRGVKLDLADLHEHVVLDKSEGLIRRILFTPEDPETFKSTLDEAISSFRET